MRNFCLLAAFMFFGFVPQALADDFITGFEDIPLMEGLQEQEDGLTSFDSPDGRFIQAILKADEGVSSDTIRTFYSENLAALGWSVQENGCYGREDEQLCLKIWDSQPIIAALELRSVTK